MNLHNLRRSLTGGLLLVLASSLYTVVGCLPPRVARSLGSSCGRLAGRMLRSDARRAARQLEQLPRPGRPTVSQVFRHLGISAADVCTLPRKREPLDRMVHLEGADVLAARLADRRGTVWVSGHVGNWEIPAAWAASRGIVVHVFAAPVHYPALDRWVLRLRRRHGVDVLRPGFRDMRRAVKLLRGGDQVALLIDQHVRGRGTLVPFLGRPAWTPTGAARLARRASVPVGLVSCVRGADGRYRLRFGPVFDPELGPERLTAELTAALEQVILHHPEQWVWMHDRWRRSA